MNRLFLFYSFLMGVVSLFSQGNVPSKSLISESYIHDFGLVNQSDGDVFVDFTLSNTSNDTVIITGIKEDCSCTKPFLDKDTVLIGQSLNVKIGYLSSSNSGEFNKTVSIFTIKDTINLSIIGVVKSIPESMDHSKFPVSVGGIMFQDNVFSLKNIYDKYPAKRTFEIYNSSSDTLTSLDYRGLPENITLKVIDTIFPGAIGEIMVMHEVSEVKNYGFISHSFNIANKDSVVKFTVSKNVTPYLEYEEGVNPSIQFVGGSEVDLGHVEKERNYKVTLTVKNSGNGVLEILQVKPSCDCVTVDPYENKFMSQGEKTSIVVNLSTVGKVGKIKKRVYIYSNDISKPAYVYLITARVNK